MTYRKVQCKIPTEIGVYDRVLILAAVGRIHGLHGCIKTEHEHIEFQPHTQAVRKRQFLIETAESKLTTGLFLV